MYEKGELIDQDYTKAYELYKIIPFLNFHKLGYMHQHGLGVPQDYNEAVRYYKLNSDDYSGDCSTSLAVMYELGQGVEQDFEEAARLHILAAKKRVVFFEDLQKVIDEMRASL